MALDTWVPCIWAPKRVNPYLVLDNQNTTGIVGPAFYLDGSEAPSFPVKWGSNETVHPRPSEADFPLPRSAYPTGRSIWGKVRPTILPLKVTAGRWGSNEASHPRRSEANCPSLESNGQGSIHLRRARPSPRSEGLTSRSIRGESEADCPFPEGDGRRVDPSSA